MAIPGVSRRGFWITGFVLVVLGSLLLIQHLRIQRSLSTIERSGGGISDDEVVPFFGPSFVTFRIPGNSVTPTDNDAKAICQALSRLSRLKRVDFTGIPLGDPFFIELSQRCRIEFVQLDGTRCGDIGVQALAANAALNELSLTGLSLSPETFSLLDRKGIRYVR